MEGAQTYDDWCPACDGGAQELEREARWVLDGVGELILFRFAVRPVRACGLCHGTGRVRRPVVEQLHPGAIAAE